ncbi:MAG TPA: hypothetical protein VFU88_14695 [Ktedonobacterales bacterium]|nr:hypothetical protein [Ktedonobacterales bacterium]
MTLFWLRLRTRFTGWGGHPEDLRFLSWHSLRVFWVYTAAEVFVILSIPVWMFIERRPVDFGRALLATSVLQAFFVTTAVSSLTRTVIYRRRAREATLDPEHLMGYCYGIAFDPPSPCYFRFGPTSDTAEWYLVPLEWEELISAAPPATPFELWVLPVTGWVERLRCGSSEPQEVSQSAPEPLPAGGAEPNEHPPDEAAVDQPEDEGGTPDEVLAMRHFARRAGLIWLRTPRQIFWSWAFPIAAGLFICIGAVVYEIWLIIRYPRVIGSDGRAILLVLLILFEVLGLLLVACGLRPFIVWRRVRRLDSTPTQATGEVVAYCYFWGSASTGHDQSDEKFIQLRAADGSDRIFRLPPKLAHRVQRRGEHVRITYRTGNGHVLDVRHVEVPVQATVTDGSA